MNFQCLTLLFLFLHVLGCSAVTDIDENSIIYLKKAGKSKMVQLARGDTQYFCVKGSDELTPASWFYHSSFLVKSNEMMGNFVVYATASLDISTLSSFHSTPYFLLRFNLIEGKGHLHR